MEYRSNEQKPQKLEWQAKTENERGMYPDRVSGMWAGGYQLRCIGALLIRAVLQNIPRLAVECLANCRQGLESNTLDLALLEQRQIGLRYADELRQLFGLQLAPGQHDIEVDDDCHGLKRNSGFPRRYGRLAVSRSQSFSKPEWWRRKAGSPTDPRE